MLVFPLLLLLGISMYRWNAKFDAALVSKVNDEWTIARQHLTRILENSEEHPSPVPHSARFQEVLRKYLDGHDALANLLRESAQRCGFDSLYVVNDDRPIIVSEYPMVSSSMCRAWPMINPAFEGRSQTDRTEDMRSLVLKPVSPLALPDGRRDALAGDIFLHQNLGFVDRIHDLIDHGSDLHDGTQEAVPLFLDDVRIGTDIRLFKPRRAIEMRVSPEAQGAVLEQKRTWLDSAIADGYISGYEPIRDGDNRSVDMLNAGLFWTPFTEATHWIVLQIWLAFLLTVATTVLLFLRWATETFRPLEGMIGTITRVKSGDLAARTWPVESEDEIGRVALHLDYLLDQLQVRDMRLRQLNEDLNQRVSDRTSKLQLANQQLEATTKQLIMSEKLAAIGEITSGVAHEINNPITVMMGNLEVIRDLMGSKVEVAQTEFRLIDEQLHRISEIVTRLLRFAKPQEYAGYPEQYDVAEVVTDTLPLVQYLLKKTTIIVEREDRTSRLILMNRTELQQVLVNLMVNAIHAMPDGGRLNVRTYDRDDGGRPGVVIEIADTGAGMTRDVMQRIFDPFFTTKGQEGNGLGLSICQMLVIRQGGKISTSSELGRGTTFVVWLPGVS